MPRDFDAHSIINTIDHEKFEKIRKRFHVEDPGDTPAKYLDLPTWLEANLQRVRDLELDIGRRRRVLDIGSGSGYFLYICKLLGHDAVGLDVDDMPMFNQTIALLGVNRIVWRIQKFVPSPISEKNSTSSPRTWFVLTTTRCRDSGACRNGIFSSMTFHVSSHPTGGFGSS